MRLTGAQKRVRVNKVRNEAFYSIVLHKALRRTQWVLLQDLDRVLDGVQSRKNSIVDHVRHNVDQSKGVILAWISDDGLEVDE